MARHTFTRTFLMLLFAAGFATTASAQSVFYTFSSGPDGVSWPASPTGLLDSGSFFTPGGVDIFNDTGNNLFFDNQYQVVGNGSRISGDAMWGNPLDFGGGNLVSIDFSNINGTGIQTLDFDFAWSEAGVPAVSDFFSFQVVDSDGRGSFGGWTLNDTFTGFGGGIGYEDHVSLDASMFTDDDFNVDGGAFIDIAYIDIFVEDISFGGNNSEFAIDNLATDGAGAPGPGGEVFPSVNQGQFDVTGSSTGTSALRGTGTAGIGLEVTNASGSNTTYSVQLQAGGGLSAGTIVSGDTILNGESIFTPDIATVDRSLPAGDYTSQVVTINDGDPLDPDNTSSLSIDLLDAPLLTGTAGTVDVSTGQNATLSNAAGPFRASVKFDPGTTTTTGPFTLVSDFDDVRVLPGGSASATPGFNRFGQLSGTHAGTLSTSVTMTHYIVNAQVDFESFLGFAEPVPDQQWTLNFDLPDTPADSLIVAAGENLGPNKIGVNDANTAVTIKDGTSSSAQTFDFVFVIDPDPASASLVGDPVDLSSSVGPDLFVIEFTFDAVSLPPELPALDLTVVEFNTTSSDYNPAINLNGDSGAGSAMFLLSYEDYLAGPGGGSLDAGDLSAFGIDLTNNHAWAILDHNGIFGLGILTPAIPGDLDGDGFVGINDLNLVLGNWNLNVPPADPLADTNNDNFVGLVDLNTVLGNWNAGTPPNATANIPEPGTLGVLGLLGATLLRRSRSMS